MDDWLAYCSENSQIIADNGLQMLDSDVQTVIEALAVCNPVNSPQRPTIDERTGEIRKMQDALDRAHLENSKLKTNISRIQVERDSLQTELQRIRTVISAKLTDHTCPICLDRRKDALILPSRMFICDECASAIMRTTKLCPFTRKHITRVVRGALQFAPSPVPLKIGSSRQ